MLAYNERNKMTEVLLRWADGLLGGSPGGCTVLVTKNPECRNDIPGFPIYRTTLGRDEGSVSPLPCSKVSIHQAMGPDKPQSFDIPGWNHGGLHALCSPTQGV